MDKMANLVFDEMLTLTQQVLKLKKEKAELEEKVEALLKPLSTIDYFLSGDARIQRASPLHIEIKELLSASNS